MNHKPQTINQKNGFTLIELSIVIILLGLLIGGVMGGQELLKQYKITATITQMNEITSAANAFELKYNGLPGDLKDATEYWGALGSGLGSGSNPDTSCIYSFDIVGNGTCNGDGNGLVRGSDNDLEDQLFWQHLIRSGIYKKAEMINYQFFLRVKAQQDAFYVISNNNYLELPINIQNQFSQKNLFILAGEVSPNQLKSDIAQAIDYKIDDGRPLTGDAAVAAPELYSCIDTDKTNQYGIDKNQCRLVIIAAF